MNAVIDGGDDLSGYGFTIASGVMARMTRAYLEEADPFQSLVHGESGISAWR